MKKIKIAEYITISEDSILNISFSGPIEEYTSFITNSIKQIITSQNPRHLILESWLLLDFSIRQLIVSGIGAQDTIFEDFDLKYKLLPNSFRSCVSFLEEFIKNQSSLPLDPHSELLKLPFSFKFYINEDIDPEERDTIHKIIDQYNKKMVPHLDSEYLYSEKERDYEISFTLPKKPIRENIKYKTVSSSWLTTVSGLNQDWFKGVNKINEARNKAAHSYNEDDIYSKFGLNGQDRFQRLKETCINSIEQLLEIKIDVNKV